MKRTCIGLMALVAFGAALPSATAGWEVTISAESVDLSHLTVGQTVTFGVTLSGLQPGDALDYLAATVTFDSTLLGSAFNVTPGAIIPDPSGFVSDTPPNIADAFYDAVFFATSDTPITANGTFFTFQVTAQKAGSGTVSFDPTSLAATDGNNAPVPLGGGAPVPFDIQPSGPTAAPAPPAWALLLSGALASGAVALGRRSVRRARACLRMIAGCPPHSA